MKGKAHAQVQIPPQAMLYSSLCKSRRQKIIFHKESLNPLVSEKMFKSLSLEANEPLNESRNVVALYNIKMLYHLNKQTSFERKGHVQLQSKSIKVHSFYVDKRAKENFEKIASFTNGNCRSLDIQSNQGSEDLLNLINVEILDNIGGDNLVNSYKKLYHFQ